MNLLYQLFGGVTPLLNISGPSGAQETLNAADMPDALSVWDQILALTLFGSVTWAIIIGVLFLIIVLVSDYNENGWAITLSFAGLLTLFGIWGSTPLWVVFPLLSWKFLAFYLTVGLGFALLRTYFYAKNYAKRNSYSSKEDIMYDLKRDLGGNVFRWWFVWPVSFLIWVFGDLLVDLFEFIWPKIRGIFMVIASAGINNGQKLNQDKKR